ncbi:ATP-binding protein [Streptomyces sp. NPDC051569]|uniref:ATP-binding protein n=1 Tax=Streptomyces sp. NPDC051569 TaxID=3365661 RepID=UPI0037B114E5
MNPKNSSPVADVRQFAMLLSSTRRGARLARLLTVQQLIEWDTSCDAAHHVVAELAANAVLHGHVAGRDFRLALGLSEGGTLRVEVADTRGEAMPQVGRGSGPEAETGRGLLLVEAMADRWGVAARQGPGKTVWAEFDLGR